MATRIGTLRSVCCRLAGVWLGAIWFQAQVARVPAQHQRVGRDRDHGQDDRQDDQGRPPTVVAHQPIGERNEDDAGEAAAEGQDCQRPPAEALEPVGDGDEGRFVKGRRHRHADGCPDQIEGDQVVDRGPGEDKERRADRADRHQQARTVAVEPAAHRHAGDAGDEQRQREGAGHLRARPAEIGFHRLQEDGDRVVLDAPGG
jgi:hypothetical protein